jgi:hypothetical protein
MGMLKKKIWDLVKLTSIPEASQNRLITKSIFRNVLDRSPYVWSGVKESTKKSLQALLAVLQMIIPI